MRSASICDASRQRRHDLGHDLGELLLQLSGSSYGLSGFVSGALGPSFPHRRWQSRPVERGRLCCWWRS